jgi:hypothetical protein
MKKLFVLCSHFGTLHTIKQFGASYKHKKIKITVFSILPLLHQRVFRSFYNKKNNITVINKNFINIKSYFELIKIINKSKNKSYFYNAAYSSILSTLIELFLINFKKFKKIQIFGEISPTPKNDFLKEILYLYKNDKILLIKKIYSFLFYKLKTFILNLISIKKSTFIFLDNKKYYDIFKNKNYFNVHKFDNENYSNYLKSKKKRERKRKKYIVFLDQDLDNNFDKSLSKNPAAKFDSELYWKKINFFFSELEKQFRYKYKIVIAAHHRRPKGNYPINRKFIHNNTGNLVKDSFLVLAHHSLSINYGIFYNKPILLLNTSIFNLDTFTRKNFIALLKKRLGLKVINLDNKVVFNKKNLEKILLVDKKKYIAYFNRYLGFNFNQTKGEKWAVISKVLGKN